MKRLLFLLCVLLGCAGGYAQRDDSAVALLNRLSAKYKTSTGTRVKVKITIDDTKTKTHQGVSGTLTAQGRKFRLVTPAATMLFDGKTLYTYNKQSDEVTVSEPEADEVKDLDPTAVLTVYKQGYKIDKPEEGTRGGHRTALVKLYPENLDESFFKVEMLIDTDANMPLGITTFSKNGVTNRIDILAIETGQTFPAKEFTFSPDQFPGAEIVDIR